MPNKSLLKVSYITGYIIGVLECCTVFGIFIGLPVIFISNYVRKIYNLKNDLNDKEKEKFFYVSIIYAFLAPLSGILALIYYIALENNNLKMLKKEHTKK